MSYMTIIIFPTTWPIMWPTKWPHDLPCDHKNYHVTNHVTIWPIIWPTMWPYDLSWPIIWPHDLSCDQPCNHMKFLVTYHVTIWPFMLHTMWLCDLYHVTYNTYNMTFYVIIWITMMTYQYQRSDDHVYENIPHKEEDDHRIRSCGQSCSGGWRLLDPEHSPLPVLWLSPPGRTSLTTTSDNDPSFPEVSNCF